MNAPQTFAGVAVPAPLRERWQSWDAVDWRVQRWQDRHNGAYPADQRFTVTPLPGMCPQHHHHWITWRDRWFRGIRFPGPGAGDGFCNSRTRSQVSEDWERARVEWDRETIEQMRSTERICRSGRSTTCGPVIDHGRRARPPAQPPEHLRPQINQIIGLLDELQALIDKGIAADDERDQDPNTTADAA